MTLRLRLSPRPALRRVCQACETRRRLLRRQGITRWERDQALCGTCYAGKVARERDLSVPEIRNVP